MNQLQITKEKVLEAASKCPQAKETLKTLFPELFKEDGLYHPDSGSSGTDIARDNRGIISIGFAFGIADNLGCPELSGHCFFLDAKRYNWELGPKDKDYQLLIPTKK